MSADIQNPIDFDGTIFMQDTGHVLFDSHGCGAERREVLDQQIKSGERSFKAVSEEMWGSLNVSLSSKADTPTLPTYLMILGTTF